MSSIKSLKLIVCSAWMLILSTFIAYWVFQPNLPSEILNSMANDPNRPYSWIVLCVCLVYFFMSSIGIWNQKNFGRFFLIATTLIYLTYEYFSGTRAVYYFIAYFDDTINLLLGVMIALVFSEPFKKLFDEQSTFTLATNHSLKIFCGFLFTTVIVYLFVVELQDSMHQTFSSLLLAFHDKSIFSGNFILVIFTLFLISIGMLYFRSLIGKYIFTISIMLVVFDDGLTTDALTGLEALIGCLEFILIGIVLGIIYSKPLSEELSSFGNKLHE